jgi:hypothetical protein
MGKSPDARLGLQKIILDAYFIQPQPGGGTPPECPGGPAPALMWSQ